MTKQSKVTQLLTDADSLRIGSAYAAAWGNLDHLAEEERVCFGKTSRVSYASSVIDANTYFDLASLTKIISTTSILMVMVDRGLIDVQASLEKYLPDEVKKYPHLKGIKVVQLLSHTSGLPAWRAYYEELKLKFGSNLPFVSIAQRKEYFYSRVFETTLEAVPGEKMVYSDVGFLILGYLIEKLNTGHTLDRVARELVWDPIELKSKQKLNFHYRPVLCDAAGAIDQAVVATEVCPWRGLLQGQVHDDNSWSMGGVSAHAGVWGSLADVLLWMRNVFSGQLVSFQTLRQFFSEVKLNSGIGSARALGFDFSPAFSSNTVGHLGFTGTSLWVDLDRGNYACLLTNRVHPLRSDLRIRELRQNFHLLVK